MPKVAAVSRRHQIPTFGEVVEANVLKLVTRVLVPIFLAIGAWLGPRYLDQIVENLRQQITTATALAQKTAADVQYDRTQNLQVQNQLTQALADVQRAAASQQATATAQYQELKSNQSDMGHRVDRLEDKVDGNRHK